MKKLLLLGIIALSISSFAQTVNIPDPNFKAYLVGNTAINTNADTEIQVSEANAFTGTIDCEFSNISDLTGIEEFTALTYLNCGDNPLTALNVSNNTALTSLYCYYNQLTALDLSNNTALDSLNCIGNQLSGLDLSNNIALTVLICYNNQLTALDVSSNIDLTILQCYSNLLTALDVSNNTSLDYLWCTDNQLTALDVSNNTALTTLVCGDNQLTALDVSNNTALTGLFCWSNLLTVLDVSNNTALADLSCLDNQLTCLNVKNGNNTNFTNFSVSNNPNLTCIEVDDVSYSNANWTLIDVQTSFSTDCNNACSGSLGIKELTHGNGELVKITDLMGRETTFRPNTPLIYYYTNGTIEKMFKSE